MVMEEDLPLLRTRVHRPPGLILRHGMTEGEREVLVSLGLYHIMFMPKIRSNNGLLTALAERWHSKTSSFHLSTEEAIVTLEDVWHILRIPIYVELVMYDPVVGQTTLNRMFRCGDAELGIQDYEIGWEVLVAFHERLVVVTCWAIGGLLIPDRRGHRFLVRWGRVLE